MTCRLFSIILFIQSKAVAKHHEAEHAAHRADVAHDVPREVVVVTQQVPVPVVVAPPSNYPMGMQPPPPTYPAGVQPPPPPGTYVIQKRAFDYYLYLKL